MGARPCCSSSSGSCSRSGSSRSATASTPGSTTAGSSRARRSPAAGGGAWPRPGPVPPRAAARTRRPARARAPARRSRRPSARSRSGSTSTAARSGRPALLGREPRKRISRRIDSSSMAAILLDVDGVLHVSGEPIPGAVDAVRRLRSAGHRLRFVTNSTTMSRRQLGELLRGMGFALDDEELQTTGRVAARVLAGKRVLALTMPGLLDDLEGLELIGINADAVLIGGCDEGEEPGRVFSYLNLNRAFLELEAGAELYCLHKNRWWQTQDGPKLDAGAFVAGLEYAADVEATVLGKPSHEYFAAALEALDADPELAWMVGDDVEGDIRGAQRHGMRTVLVRTGKFRPDEVESSGVVADGILSSIAQLPDWLEANP